MVNAICTELVLRKYESKNALETIYFGGGTPSVLSKAQLDKIMHVVHENYLIAENPEITLEANPDDLTVEKLIELKEADINRLSIGVQSFRSNDLQWMNRSHDVDQAISCVRNARKAGFYNITIDLIYGIPGLSASDWENNLMKAVELNPDHISAYCLTIEKKTVFGHRFSRGEMQPIDDEKSSEQFLFMCNFLQRHGFEQYEVSNFAKKNFYSRHNRSYWQGKSYLGIGPSAHSFDGQYRRWNTSSNTSYMKAIEEGLEYFEEEELTEKDKFNEFIMISLRTNQGIALNRCKELFGTEACETLVKEADSYIQGKYLIFDGTYLKATQNGLLIVDRIASDLFRNKM